VDFLNQLAGI